MLWNFKQGDIITFSKILGMIFEVTEQKVCIKYIDGQKGTIAEIFFDNQEEMKELKLLVPYSDENIFRLKTLCRDMGLDEDEQVLYANEEVKNWRENFETKEQAIDDLYMMAKNQDLMKAMFDNLTLDQLTQAVENEYEFILIER